MAALCGAAGYFVYKTIQIYRRKSTFQDVFKVGFPMSVKTPTLLAG
jgi:hypothetical protein